MSKRSKHKAVGRVRQSTYIKGNVNVTASWLTPPIALLHCVTDICVVDNDRCVVTRWSCVEADRWTRMP